MYDPETIHLCKITVKKSIKSIDLNFIWCYNKYNEIKKEVEIKMMTYKDCEELIKILENFAKRSKTIGDIEVNYYGESVRIDMRVTKTTGKIYREMVETLNSMLPYTHSNKDKWPCDWWHSYDCTLMNPYMEGKWEIELCVRYW